MIYADGREPDPIADLLSVLEGAVQPTDFLVAGGYCYTPEDGEDHYFAHEAAAEAFCVVRYPVAPVHTKLRPARTALGAGILR